MIAIVYQDMEAILLNSLKEKFKISYILAGGYVLVFAMLVV